MSVQVEKLGEFAQPCRLTSSRAAKSARIPMPKMTSSISVMLVEGRNEVAMMNSTVTISNASRA